MIIFFFSSSFLGKISPWTGRFYSLLDPSYAKNNIPIIASVSEHQPTTWSSYYFDLQLLVFMFPGEPSADIVAPRCIHFTVPHREGFILPAAPRSLPSPRGAAGLCRLFFIPGR